MASHALQSDNLFLLMSDLFITDYDLIDVIMMENMWSPCDRFDTEDTLMTWDVSGLP